MAGIVKHCANVEVGHVGSTFGRAWTDPTDPCYVALNLPDTSEVDWPAYVVKLTEIARTFPEPSPSTLHRHA